MNQIISEAEFREELSNKLRPLFNKFNSVSGPGRSGAIAAVYASHYLGIPFVVHGRNIPDYLQPHLVIDTAIESGKTLKKAIRKAKAQTGLAIYNEPPRVKFWYELYLYKNGK